MLILQVSKHDYSSFIPSHMIHLCEKMQSGIVTTLSVFKANVILQGSMTGCSYLVRCDPPAEDLKQPSEVTSESSCELETFKEP